MEQPPRLSGRVRATPARFNNFEQNYNVRKTKRVSSKGKAAAKMSKKNIQRITNINRAILFRSENDIWGNNYNRIYNNTRNNSHKVRLTREALKMFLDSIGLEEVQPENTEIRLIGPFNAHVYSKSQRVGFYDLDDKSLRSELPPELVIAMRFLNRKLEKERIVRFNDIVNKVI
jgi:hypothetical protein